MKFDLHVLARVGINIKTTDVFDVMCARWLCDENEGKSLKENSANILSVDQTKFKDLFETVTKEEKKLAGLKSNSKPTIDLVRCKIAGEYALDDAYYTWELYLHFLHELEKEGMEKIFYRTYPPFLLALFKMEELGVSVDKEKLEKMGIDMQEDLDLLVYQMYEIAGVEFNPSSNQQLAELLFGYNQSKNSNKDILSVSFGFPCFSVTAKGMPQTSNQVLEFLSRASYKNARKLEGLDLVKKLVEYKKLQKLKTAFVDGILHELYDDGKVHPNFNIVGTDSGRISCSSPNLQQMPKAGEYDKYQIRSVFIGDIDPITNKRMKIIAIDYENLEMKVLTHFSMDRLLLNMFEHNNDSHGSTAVNMFKLDCHPNECKEKYPILRQVGKVLNFLKTA